MIDNINQSKNTGKVSNALAKVQKDIGVLKVDKAGYNYEYLTLAKMLEVLLPIAGKNGLSIAQFPKVIVINEQPWVGLTTRISCEEEYFDSYIEFPMIEVSKKTDTDIMMMGSTISYLRRFVLQSIFAISGADKDPEQMQKEQIETTKLKG